MEKSEKKELSFEYRISPTYSVYAISGAVGGVSPGGEIIANLFSERNPIPKKVKHQIEEDGRLGKEIEREVVDSLIRNVMFGISMNPNVAKALGEWLIRKATEHEVRVTKRKEGVKLVQR